MSKGKGLKLQSEAASSGLNQVRDVESDYYEECEPESFVMVSDESSQDKDTKPQQSCVDPSYSGFDQGVDVQDLIKRAVKVVNVSIKDRNVLRNIVSLKKDGGGDIETELYSSRERLVYFIFEDHQVASNWLEKGTHKTTNKVFKFEPPEIVEYLSINNGTCDGKKELDQSNKIETKRKRKKKKSRSKKCTTTKKECRGLEGEVAAAIDGEEEEDDDEESDVADRDAGNEIEEISGAADADRGSSRNPREGPTVEEVEVESERSTQRDGSAETKPEDFVMSFRNQGFDESIVPSCRSAFPSLGKEEVQLGAEGRRSDDMSSLKLENSIFVYGVPSRDFVDDALLLHLEHRRRGGGEISEVGGFDALRKRVYVTFRDSKVAENFLARKSLRVQGHDMFVISPGEEFELQRMVLVSDVDDGDLKDNLLILLESTRKGGGKIERDKYDHRTKELCIAFAEKPVADRLKKAGRLKIFSRIFLVKEAPLLFLVDVDLSSRTVFVGKVVEGIDRVVVDLLESERYGGPLLHHLVLGGDVLQVVFYSESVSRRLLAAKSLTVMNETFHVARSAEDLDDLVECFADAADDVPTSEPSVDRPMSAEFDRLETSRGDASALNPNDSERESSRKKATAEATTGECFYSGTSGSFEDPTLRGDDEGGWAPRGGGEVLMRNMRMVLLTDVSGIESKKLLETYMCNQGFRGEVKYFDVKKKEAAIEFEHEKDAERFCERQGELLEATACQLEVNPRDFESHAVVASNAKGLDANMLLYYFENERHSGGGPVKECNFRDESKFYVVFADARDARSVLEREHILSGKRLELREMMTQPPPPHVREEVADGRRLFVSNLKPRIDEKNFVEVVEGVGRARVEELIKGRKLSMLVFQSPPDYYALRKYTSCFPIGGYMVSLRRVPLAREIQLALPLGYDVERVRRHLSSMVVDDDDEATADVNEENGLVVMTFKKQTSVQRILSSGVSLDGFEVAVKPYFELLRVDAVRPVVPTEAKVFCCSEVLEFVARRPNLTTEIEASLQALHPVQVLWMPVEGEVALKLPADHGVVDHEWKKSAESELKRLLAPYRPRERSFLKDPWPEVASSVKRHVDSDEALRNLTEVSFDEAGCTIRFNGTPEACRQLEDAIDGISMKILSRKKRVSELVRLNQMQVELVKKFDGLLDGDGRRVDVSDAPEGLALDGPSELVSELRLKIYEKSNNFVSEEQEVDDFFLKSEVLAHIDRKLREKGRFASFQPSSSEEEKKILVMAECEASLEEVRSLFAAVKKSGRLELDPDRRAVIGMSSWRDFILDLGSELAYFEVREDADRGLSYSCVDEAEGELLRRINAFLEVNRLEETFVELQCGLLRGMRKFLKGEFDELEGSFRKEGGKVTEKTGPKGQSGLSLVGKKSTLKSNLAKLEDLKKKVHLEKMTLKKPNITGFFETKGFKRFVKELEETKDVIVCIHSDGTRAPEGGPKSHEYIFMEKFKVEVTTGDVSGVAVDVVINVSPVELDPDTQKIFELGGHGMISAAKQELNDDDDNKRKNKNNKLFDCKVVGNLPCKSTYHVVVSESDLSSDPESLSNELLPALEDADGKKFLSASIFCPTSKDGESRTTALVRSLAAFVARRPEHLQRFVLLFEEADATNICRSLLTEYEKGRVKFGASDDDEAAEGSSNIDSEQFEFVDADQCLQRIEVVRGSIIQVKADVIVNSTSKELDLSRGQVSSCLLAAAGKEMQDECRKKRPESFSDGDIVVTGGYQLNCRAVFHTSFGAWKGSESAKIVRKIVLSALTEASSHVYKSIAFPALGTGNLRAPPKEVAELMFREAISYLTNYKKTRIEKIYFVVYEKDLPTCEAFEECRKRFAAGGVGLLESDLPNEGSGEASGGAGAEDQSGSAGGSSITMDASNPLKLSLEGVDVEVVKGDITTFPADAVVNSTNQKMDLSGAVARAIVKKGGSQLVEELKSAKMPDSGVCVTKAGKLPANFIVHVVAQRNVEDWRGIVFEALKEADAYGCTSVVFPALGTGNFNQPVEEMARIMINSFTKFAGSSHRKNVSKIFVCIFLDDVLEGFVEGMKRPPHTTKSLTMKVLSSLKKGVVSFFWREPPPRETPAIPAVDHSIQTCEVVGLVPGIVSEVAEMIRSHVGNQFYEKVLESERDKILIGKLKNSQISELKSLKEMLKVDIKVDSRENSRKIIVSGFHENFTEAVRRVMDVLKKVDDDDKEMMEAECLQKQIIWEFKDGNTFKSYDPVINLKMEKAFNSGEKNFSWEEAGVSVIVRFGDLKEVRNGQEADIRRVKAGFLLPRHWSSVPNSVKYSVVTLPPDQKEFADVQANFMATSNNTVKKIHTIERIQNPTLYGIYQARKEEMEKSLPGTTVEMTLWHGTSSNVIKQVNESGFNRSYCGKNATVYGRGVYFAKNVYYSAHNTYSVPDSSGEKSIYQCKVLVGSYALGSQNLIVPPVKPGSSDSHDSVVNNVASPEIFVIFYDNQAYPEYLIRFS